MQQDQWHYRDERSGKRVGPVDRDEISQLITAAQIDRSTLVWNPAQADWEKAGETDLNGLFGDTPPPLPANAISRWAIYAMALFPLWGLVVRALVCAAFGNQIGLSPSDMFDHRAWPLFFLIGNAVLGVLDERQLERGGLKLKGAAIIAGLVTPLYIWASCRTFGRHAGRGWASYFPAILWILAFAASFPINGLVFDPDAPLIFRPDAWF